MSGSEDYEFEALRPHATPGARNDRSTSPTLATTQYSAESPAAQSGSRIRTPGGVSAAPVSQQPGTSNDDSVEETQAENGTTSNPVEQGYADWVIKSQEGEEESDKYRQYLLKSARRWAAPYQDFHLDHENAVRCAFAFFSYTPESPLSGGAQTRTRCILPPNQTRNRKHEVWMRRLVNQFLPPTNEVPFSKSISAALLRLTNELREEPASGMQLMALAKKTTSALDTFTYWRMFRLGQADSTWLRQARRRVPLGLLLPALSFSKFVEKEVLDRLERLVDSVPTLPEKLLVQLPSKRTINRLDEVANFTFAWPRSSPSPSKIDLYLRQTYRKPSNFEEVSMVWKFSEEEEACFKVLLLFDTDTALASFSEALSKETPSHKSPKVHRTRKGCFAKAQFYRSLYCLYRQMIGQTRNFVENSLFNLHSLDLVMRDSPGRTKLLYLFLLGDYVKRTKEELSRATATLGRAFFKGEHSAPEGAKQELTEDLAYLLERLDFLENEIALCSTRLETLSTFKQAQRNAVVGFLIGLYVPLAFVTSYFGMNTIEINGSSWPLSSFWESAVPLTVVTMLTPITFGPLVRSLAKASSAATKRLKSDWPAITHQALILLCLVLLSWHAGSNNWTTAGYEYPGIYSFTDFWASIWVLIKNIAVTAKMWIVSFCTKRSAVEPLVVGSILAFLALLGAVRVSRTRKGLRSIWFWFWTATFSVAALCAGLSRLEGGSSATLVMPFVVLASPLYVPLFIKMLSAFKRKIRKSR